MSIDALSKAINYCSWIGGLIVVSIILLSFVPSDTLEQFGRDTDLGLFVLGLLVLFIIGIIQASLRIWRFLLQRKQSETQQ